MDQILPVEDDDDETELRIISSSFADPYLLILCDNSTVKLFKAVDNGEVEEVECGALSSDKWLSASLFSPSFSDEVYAFLLTADGGLQVRFHHGPG
jgi:cleavage and polyadenylation specificity factor subunit 1